jgi:putative flippase GtrA
MNILKKTVSRQFIKFCLIGLESTVLNYLVFIISLYFLSIYYLIASAMGYLSGTFFGYFFNKVFTFNSNRKNSQAVPLYLAVYTFSLFFTIGVMKMLVDFLGIHPMISKLIVIFMTTIINFIGIKIIVFKNKEW